MKNTLLHKIVILSLCCLFAHVLYSQSKVEIKIDLSERGINIPEDFIGLSFEMEKVLPDISGKYFFSPSNKSLVEMFKMLGIKSLRLGGNTADRPTIRVPDETDIDTLFAFARAVGVKVIYTLRLKLGDPNRAAEIAEYIIDNYKSFLDCFAIGNEPNVFAKDYPSYKTEWKKYADRIKAKSPEAEFCGPGSTPGKSEWSRNFTEDFEKSGLIKYITQHSYPGGNGRKVTDPALGCSDMLSKKWVESYQSFYDSFVPFIQSKNFSCRLEETNNFFHGGAINVSNTFASALWGLDYMFWWVQHGVGGINFHTGDSIAAGEFTSPCMYAAFVTSQNGYSVRPLGYAIKAFALVDNGKIFPVQIVSNPDSINFTAYAVLSPNKDLFITLINKEIELEGKNPEINLITSYPFTNGEIMFLNSSTDLAATSGIKLGGEEITEDVKWNGMWTPLLKSGNGSKYVFNLPGASVALVKLYKK